MNKISRFAVFALVASAGLFAVSCHSPTASSGSSVSGGGGGGGGTTTTATWTPVGQVYMAGAWVAPFGTPWYIWGNQTNNGDVYVFKTDATNAYNGDAGGLMFDIKNSTNHTSGGWAGGAFYLNTATNTDATYFNDLSGTGFNAYTFVLKGDITSGPGVDKKLTIGFGVLGGDDPSVWLAGFSIPATWTPMVMPIPNDNDNLRVGNPLFFLDQEGDNGTSIMGSTYWVDNVQFSKDTTDTIVLNSFTAGTISLASALGVGSTAALQETKGTNSTFNYTVNGSPVVVDGFGVRMFKWTSSDPTVASVDGNGVVTGVKAGTVTLTPSVGSVNGTPISVTVAGS